MIKFISRGLVQRVINSRTCGSTVFQLSQFAVVPIGSSLVSHSMGFLFSTEKKEPAQYLNEQIPEAIDSYQDLVKLKGTFDNTRLLSLLSSQAKIYRFSWPRYSGKSVFLSMIHWCYFWSIVLKDDPDLQNKKQEVEKLELEIPIYQNRLSELYMELNKKKNWQFEQLQRHSSFKNLVKVKRRVIQMKQQQIKCFKELLVEIPKIIQKLKKEIQEKKQLLIETYQFRNLFEGKSILQDQNFMAQYKMHPTIRFELSPLYSSGQQAKKEALRTLQNAVSQSFSSHRYLGSWLVEKRDCEKDPKRRKLWQRKLQRFNDYTTRIYFSQQINQQKIFSGIPFLCSLLKERWNSEPFILINQYDNVYLSIRLNPYKEKIVRILDKFYKNILMGPNQQNYFKAVIASALPIKYSNYENEIKNIEHINLQGDYPYFGVTQEEVDKKLEYFLRQRMRELNYKEEEFERIFQEQRQQLKAWIGGYWISGHEFYHQRTVNTCFDSLVFSNTLPLKHLPYGHVSSFIYNMIKQSIKLLKDEDEQTILSFVSHNYEISLGKTFERFFEVRQLYTLEGLFYIMFHSGLLTKDRQRPNYYVVPNLQINKIFKFRFSEFLKSRFPDFNSKQQLYLSFKILENIENINVFTKLLERLYNVLNESLKQYYKSMYRLQYDFRRILWERDSTVMKIKRDVLEQGQAEREKMKDFQGFFIKIEKPPFQSRQRMNWFAFSETKDIAIIHKDIIIERQEDFEIAKCRALKSILQLYLKNTEFIRKKEIQNQREQRKKKEGGTHKHSPEELRYIRIAAVVFHPSHTGKRIMKNIKYQDKYQLPDKTVKIQGEAYTFTVQESKKLLEEYMAKPRQWKNNIDKGFEESKEFRDMLKRHSVTEEEASDRK